MSSEINVLAEFERNGIKYHWASEHEVKVKCPFHDDNSPSCHVNVEKRVFICHASECKKASDLLTLLAAFLKTTRAVVYADLSTRYVLEEAKLIDPQTIEKYHKRIWEAKPLLAELYKRGVTDALIRKYRLGEHDGRIMIPIKNNAGYFVNIRKYLPGAPGAEKMRNIKGHGKARLFPIEQLEYDEIMVCGGEIKAIVAAEQLNKHNIGAITMTAGEGNWDVSLSPLVAGKKIYVCLDTDEGGRKGAAQLCTHFSRVARWTGDLLLPLNTDKYPKGDINDFVGQEGGKLFPLLKNVPEWVVSAAKVLEDTDPEDTDLVKAVHANIAGKRIRVQGVVAAMDTAPYVIPKEVTITCDRSQRECAACAIYAGKDGDYKLHHESPALLEMIGARKNTQAEALKNGFGIPRTCAVVDFLPKSYYNIEDTRISPQLEITNRASDRIMQPALCIGDGAELNETYVLTGRMYPHPATQQSTLLISSYSPTRDALSSYRCSDLDRLAIFQPDNWTVDGIGARLDAIYDDLEANITRIFQRRDLHLAVDLAYHTALLMTFDGRAVKGWGEILVLGDSAQGKSETGLNLMRHYGLGEKVECKNASVAGLLGGLQKMGDRFFVTWGVIPTHDKRLVILEELKGASTEVIAKLTDMRSSGIAEIPKIEKRRTHARTRLLAFSNPRSERPLSTYNFGVEAVKELIGSPEDVRRFDFTLLVGAGEIDAGTLNRLQSDRPAVPHRFTAELCRSLILWGWTREAPQVVFEDSAMALCLKNATDLCGEFSDAVPIIDRGSARYKIARLAVALAVRTFSHRDYETILVRECHVQYITDFMRRIYSLPVFGYKDFTDAIKITENLIDPDAIRHRISQTPFPRDLIKSLLHKNSVDVQDLQDWCAWDREQATSLLSLFVRKHALKRSGRVYFKTPPFIMLLKDMLDHDTFVDRPSHIPEEF